MNNLIVQTVIISFFWQAFAHAIVIPFPQRKDSVCAEVHSEKAPAVTKKDSFDVRDYSQKLLSEIRRPSSKLVSRFVLLAENRAGTQFLTVTPLARPLTKHPSQNKEDIQSDPVLEIIVDLEDLPLMASSRRAGQIGLQVFGLTLEPLWYGRQGVLIREGPGKSVAVESQDGSTIVVDRLIFDVHLSPQMTVEQLTEFIEKLMLVTQTQKI